MRFLLDEMFSRRGARALREIGLDAAHVADHGLLATEDDRVLAFACEHDWVLVTANLRDFRPLHAARVVRGDRTPLLLVTQTTLNTAGGAQTEVLVELVGRWANTTPRPYAGEHWLGRDG